MSAAEIIDGLQGMGADRRTARYPVASRQTGSRGRGRGRERGTARLHDRQRPGFRRRWGAGDEDGDEIPDPTAMGLYHLVSRTPDMYQLYLPLGRPGGVLDGRLRARGGVPRFDALRIRGQPLRRLALRAEDGASPRRLGQRGRRGTRSPNATASARATSAGKSRLLSGCSAPPNRWPANSTSPRRRASARPARASNTASAKNWSTSPGFAASAASAPVGCSTPASRPAPTSGTPTSPSSSPPLRGREKTAETVLENAGHRDPSMDGVELSDDVSYERRDRSGSGGAGTPAAEAEDDEDQSSLGDF